MERITQKMLEARVKWLNEMTNSPASPYLKGDDDRYHAVPILEWLVSLNRQIKAATSE